MSSSPTSNYVTDTPNVDDVTADEETSEASHRTPDRRLKMILAVILGAVILGTATMFAPWSTMQLDASSVVFANREQVHGVASTASISAYGLVNQPEPPRVEGLTAQAAQPPRGVGGIPTGHLLLIGAGIITAGAVLLRNGLLALLAAAATWFAFNQTSALLKIAFDPLKGGAYNSAGPAVAVFQLCLLTTAALTVIVGVQIAVTNAKERKAEREALEAAGKPVPPTIITTLGGMVATQMARMGQVAQDQAQRTDR